MADNKYSQEDLAYVRTHVDNIERKLSFQISNDPTIRENMRKKLASRPKLADVYLTLESGPKSQEEIKTLLKISQPTVSRACSELYDAKVITKVRLGGKWVFTWTDLEQLLNISRLARDVVKKWRSATASSAKGLCNGSASGLGTDPEE